MWKILTDVKDVNIWQNWSISTVRRAVTVCSSATEHSPAVKSYSVHVAASPWCQLPTKPVPGLLSSSVSVCPARRAATIEQISISSFALLPFAVRNGKAQTSFPRLVRCPEATPAPFVFLWALEQRPKRPEAGSAADVGFSRAQIAHARRARGAGARGQQRWSGPNHASALSRVGTNESK